MKCFFTIILIIFLILISAGLFWQYGTKTISGQVFIVTKGRANIELGSLEIRFIEDKKLLKLGKENFSQLLLLISEFENKVKFEETEQKRGYKEFDYLKKEHFVVHLEEIAEGILDDILKT